MHFNMYQDKAREFRAASADEAYVVVGLFAEVGEIADKYAKALRDGAPEDLTAQVAKELGDVLWFVAALADDLGFPLADIAQGNIDKLTSRKARDVIHGSGDNR